MKTYHEIRVIHGREAPMSQIGSFIAGFRSAERSVPQTRTLLQIFLIGLTMGFGIGVLATIFMQALPR